MEFTKIGAVGSLVVLLVVGAYTLSNSDFKALLADPQWADYDTILLNYDGAKLDLLQRSLDDRYDYYRWQFNKDGSTKAYLESDLINTYKWTLFQGTLSKPYKNTVLFDYKFDEDGKHASIVYKFVYFNSSAKDVIIGDLVREIEIYPSFGEEKISFIPKNDAISYCLRFEHQTDELDKARKLGHKAVFDKLEIDVTDVGDALSSAQMTAGGKATFYMKCGKGPQIIDPVVKLGSLQIEYTMLDKAGGRETTKNGLSIFHTLVNISTNKDVSVDASKWAYTLERQINDCGFKIRTEILTPRIENVETSTCSPSCIESPSANGTTTNCAQSCTKSTQQRTVEHWEPLTTGKIFRNGIVDFIAEGNVTRQRSCEISLKADGVSFG